MAGTEQTAVPGSDLERQEQGHASRARQRMLFAIHAPRDIDTAVFTNTRQRATCLEARGWKCEIISAEDFPSVRRLGARFRPLVFPFSLTRWLFRHAPEFDAVTFHSYAGWLALRLSSFIRRFGRLRMIVQFHGLEPLYYAALKDESQRGNKPLSWRYRLVNGCLMRWVLRSSCRRADLVFCLNSEERRYLIDRRWAAADRVRCIPHPVPERFFIDRDYTPRATKLLFVGQWLGMKGIHHLVEAFSQLSRTRPELQLCCAGTLASAETVLESFPAEIRKQVSVFPRVNRTELVNLHRQSDIFVFPTLSEAFGLAAVEAMASGMPIVTTPVGAALDILQDGNSVVFCPAHDSERLAKCIAELLDDCPRREQLGRNARKAAEVLREEVVWRDYAATLNELAARPDCDSAAYAASRENRTR